MSEDTVTDEEFIDFKCPYCGEQVSFPASCAGSLQECFDCAEPLIVPRSGDDGLRIPLPITTERLTLRRFRATDWKDVLELSTNDQLFSATHFKLDGEERVVHWLEQDAAIKLTTPGVPFVLAVQVTEGAKVIGCVSLFFSDAERLQVVFYLVIHPDFRRRGFGAEAATGALGFCFKGIALHRVRGSCPSTNIAACRLFEKAGMRREGEFVQDHKDGDQWANTVACAILREEFKSTPGQ